MKSVKNFQTDFSAYSIVPTDDGSLTVFSSHFQEHSHSVNGAKKETIQCYFEATDLKNRSQSKVLTILEVGFGSGFCYDLLRTHYKSLKFNYIGLEIDEELVAWGNKNRNLGLTQSGDNFIGSNCKVLCGDARKRINEIANFDVVFQDAFSFKKNKCLWTYEWFSELLSKMDKEGILSTFSASTQVKKTLHSVGFSIRSGFRSDSKRGHIIAEKRGETEKTELDKINNFKEDILRDSY